MPMVMEAIDNMSADERLQTMEYLWAAMTRVAAPEPPIWHGQVLAERRRRAEAGEETFISLDESKRRFRGILDDRRDPDWTAAHLGCAR